MASAIRKRIILSDFLLQHDRPSDFVRSVVCDSPLPYAVAMVCASFYTLVMSLYSGFSSSYGVKIFIWLTYWSFFTLTIRFVVTAMNCVVFVCKRRNSRRLDPEESCAMEKKEEYNELPVLYKVQWVLQNVSSGAAILVSLLYWSLLYKDDKTLTARGINSHMLNSFLVLGDLLLSRAPVRIHHFFHVFLFIAAYVLFSVIYWAAGGLNHHGDNYIYALLNYSEHPGRAAGIVLVIGFVALPLMQTFLYALFKCRQVVCAKCGKREEQLADVEVSTSTVSMRENGIKDEKGKNGEKAISLDEVYENMHAFRGRNYTQTTLIDDNNMVEVGLDFENDETAALRTSQDT